MTDPLVRVGGPQLLRQARKLGHDPEPMVGRQGSTQPILGVTVGRGRVHDANAGSIGDRR